MPHLPNNLVVLLFCSRGIHQWAWWRETFESRGSIISTFRYPGHPQFRFEEFYARLSQLGFLIYPGKLTAEPCFRIGTIGHLFPPDIEALLTAIRRVLGGWESRPARAPLIERRSPESMARTTMIRTNHRSVQFREMRRAGQLMLHLLILCTCFDGVAHAQWNPLNPVVSVQWETDGAFEI